MSLGNMIKNQRESHNLTQQELANNLFVTRQTVSRWENEQGYPNLDTLIQLKNILNFSIDAAFDEEEEMVRGISRDVKSKKMYKRLFLISGSILVTCALAIIVLGYGRANQIPSIDRLNPFLSYQLGYANLPDGNTDEEIDVAVLGDPFGKFEWLKIKNDIYDSSKDIALIQHKGSYVKSSRIIPKADVPSIMKLQTSGTYDEYRYENWGPRVGKEIPWSPFD